MITLPFWRTTQFLFLVNSPICTASTPRLSINSLNSANLFFEHCNSTWEHRQVVYDLIMDTKNHVAGNTKLSEKFIHYDLYYLRTGDLNRLISDGTRLMKEFQRVTYNQFRESRIGFLNEFIDSGLIKNNIVNVRSYISWLENYVPNVAIYAGSFNPFHQGHYSILKKAEKIFDKVILAVGINPEKSTNMVSEDFEKIIESFPNAVKNREIAFFDCYLTEFVKMKSEEGIRITLVKGIRDSDDLKSEITQLRYMEDQDPEISIVYIPSDRNLTHVSSRFVRELEQREPGSGEKYLL